MKCILVALSIPVWLNGNAQFRYESGIDSLRNIEWVKEGITIDENGLMNNYEQFEYDLFEFDRIVFMTCNSDLTSVILTNIIPESCFYRVLADSVINPKNDGLSNSIPRNDSISLIDQKKLDNYFLEHADSLNIDTIYVSEKIDLSGDTDIFYLLNKSLFYYNEHHNYEVGYYRLSELSGICVNDNFRLKYEGWWKLGKKQGKWKEYDKTGKLVSISKYRKGELIRTKSVK